MTKYNVTRSINTSLAHISAIPSKAAWTLEGRARRAVSINSVATIVLVLEHFFLLY